MRSFDDHAQTEEEREYYSLSRRVYPLLAWFYDAFVFPLRRLRYEVARVVEPGPGSRILDVATGTGEQAFAFAETAREVVGIDLSEAMLRAARRKNRFSNVAFEEADAVELPFEDGSFDAACVCFALHEMPMSIRRRVIREMARVTRAGGSIAIVDYALPRNRVASALVFHVVKLFERDHYASFVRSDVDALLRSAGVEPSAHRTALRSLVQIMTGRTREAVERTDARAHA